MKTPVVLSITGRQKYADQEPETIELVTEGLMSFENGGWDITYEESALTGLEGVTTTFRVEPGKVTLSRVGKLTSQMVFQEGRRHMSMYNTPYGAIEIGISTRHLMADLHAQGGNIEIDYAIEVDHALAGRNIFQINVKETQGTGLKQ